MLNIPFSMYKSLIAYVKDFISEGKWHIPDDLVHIYPDVVAEIDQIIIPKSMIDDHLVWKATDSGCLSAKDAYYFLNPCGPVCYWGKLIWSKAIPPSKSFLLRRLLHNKVPTDDHLWSRGCYVVSMCSLYGSSYETTEHLSSPVLLLVAFGCG